MFPLRRSIAALSACMSILAVISILVSSICLAALTDKARWKNIYYSPYVLLERNSEVGGKIYCSGFIAERDGHEFIMTAAHLFWTFNVHNVRELAPESRRVTKVYDARGRLIGVSYPMFIDNDYDIAVLAATKSVFDDRGVYGSFELLPLDKDELEKLVGEEVYFLGACDVGDWFFDLKSIQPFSDRTVISRVAESRIRDHDGNPTGKDMLLIFVKGGGWYGCSGGPLLYNGKVIGVCSMLENFSPKTGTAYSGVLPFCREYLDRLPKLDIVGGEGKK